MWCAMLEEGIGNKNKIIKYTKERHKFQCILSSQTFQELLWSIFIKLETLKTKQTKNSERQNEIRKIKRC